MLRYTAILFIFLSSSICAQIEKTGTPLTWGVEPGAITPSIWRTLPEFDVLSLLSQDDADQAIKTLPYRFAISTPVNYNLSNCGRWTTLNNGDRIWALGLSSEQALSLNVIFKTLNIPAGARLYIYSEDQSDYIGPLTSRNNCFNSEFPTLPMAGGEVIIEYFEPFAVRGQGEIQIDNIAQGYKTLSVPQFNEFSCFEEFPTNANEQLLSLKSSSILMLVDGGQRVATGNLVNNTIGDGEPLLLTASTALIGNPDSWVFVVNNSVSCEPSTVGLGFKCWDNALSGAEVLVENQETGLALLQVKELPKTSWGVYLSGWNKSTPSVDHYFTIQHAFGRRQSVSEYAGGLNTLTWEGLTVAPVAQWDEGNTFVGSLGSPIFNAEGMLCGALVGGNSKCNGEGSDYFGLLANAWTDFAPFLNPSGVDKVETQGFFPIFYEEATEKNDVIEVHLFPNPAQGFVYIQNETDNSVLSVSLIDMSGRKVSVYHPELPYLDVSSLPNGVYQVQINLQNQVIQKKLVVRH
ncbi:MAG: T9SS type A sorting domain-containing protein [Flavobacteriales bacterium]